VSPLWVHYYLTEIGSEKFRHGGPVGDFAIHLLA
jgi:hypothetical protein